MKLCYIFRSRKQNVFSIERVFDFLFPYFEKENNVRKLYVPNFHVTISNLIENLLSVRRTVSSDIDVYHITGDVHYVALALPRGKTCITIHDTVGLHNSNGLKKVIAKLLWFTIPVKLCARVIAISEFTKKELLELYPNCKNKLCVIPDPVDDRFVLSKKVFNNEVPEILHIGTNENKNLFRVVDALKGIKCNLHIVGKLNERQRQYLSDSGVKYRNEFCVSDERIIECYNEADVVIFVSTYEGFGMPIIEAQTVGRPVVTSDLEPMRSVAGEGACLVDPYDVASIREGVKRVIEDGKYRKFLVENGLENAKKYEAKYIAEEYMKIYREMIEPSVK